MARLGIDFGTSNSAAGIMRNGVPRLIALEADSLTLPTAVFFDFETREMRIGTAASEALLAGAEGRYMRGLKSLLGTRLMREKRVLLDEKLDFIDIVARFLAVVKARAETATGTYFTDALSGRPVHFHSNDAARDAQALIDLREAYGRAGFASVEFMNEPEAAALANRTALRPDHLGLVVDIGGGTSDFTLFRQRVEGGIDILASHGIRLGGTDFDRSLSIGRVMPQLGMGSEIRHVMGGDTHLAPNAIFNDLATWAKIPFLYGPDTRRAAAELHRHAQHPKRLARLVKVLEEELGHDLAFAVEAGKIRANDMPDGGSAMIDVSMLKPGATLPLPRDWMQRRLSGLADQIGAAAEATLRKARTAPEAVERLIFVGGSSLMHVVEAALTVRLPRAEICRGAALTAIVEGLALAAGD